MQNSRHTRIRSHRDESTPHQTCGNAITRRSFVRGMAGAAVGMGALAAGALPPATADDARAWAASDEPDTLSVTQDRVFTTDDCEYVEDLESRVSMASQASLPYGTVVWADDDNVACCLLPCETSDPLLQVGMLSLTGGNLATVIDKAAGAAEGFQIFDARLNSTGAVWVEADILNGKWRVYTARISGEQAVSAQIAAEGTSAWEMPSIAVSGAFAFWQELPVVDGPASDENSVLMRIPFGAASSEAKAVLESEGRMACSLASTRTGVACAPRAAAKGVYYELTYVEADSGQVTDTLTLPASMKPTFVGYGDTGFSFAFEDIYAYGEGISNLGTYTPAEGDVNGQWLRFARTPFTSPAWSGGLVFVKSTGVVAVVDASGRRYYTIQPEYATQGYGEFLASSGSRQRIVTYANVDYTPLNKSRVYECNVRVWNVR